MPTVDAPEPPPKEQEQREDSGGLAASAAAPGLPTTVAPPRARPTLMRLSAALGMAGLEASSVGLAGWVLRDPRWIPLYARDNHVSRHVRTWIFVNVAVALAVAALAIAIIFAWKRRNGLRPLLEKCVRLLAPLSLAALGAFLVDHRHVPGRDIVFLTFALGWGFGTRAAAVRRCCGI